MSPVMGSRALKLSSRSEFVPEANFMVATGLTYWDNEAVDQANAYPTFEPTTKVTL